MTIILDSPNKSLEVKLGSSVYTEFPWNASYVDLRLLTVGVKTFSPSTGTSSFSKALPVETKTGLISLNGVTTSVIPVTIVPHPASGYERRVTYINLVNAGSTVTTVTVQINNAGITTSLWTGTLKLGETLRYTEKDGFVVIPVPSIPAGSGESGYSGYSGRSGASGHTGVDGQAGLSGYSGFSGLGSSGFSGRSGYSGASGASGAGGSGTGTSGKSGYSGATGPAGPTGPAGADGSGSSGYSGYSGEGGSGYSGYSGYSGEGISGYSGYSGGPGTSDSPIGTPTTGAWTDGLNQWLDITKIKDAIYDLNSVEKYLAPADASSMNAQTMTLSGISPFSALLSAGNVNYKGGNGAGSTVSYVIQNISSFTVLSPNQSTTFNTADGGALKANLNGSEVDSFNLAGSFNESNRSASQTYPPASGGAGYVTVTSVSWYNSFPKWQKGNARINIVAANLRQGYNYATLVHDGIASTQTTNTVDLFYDQGITNPSITTPAVAEGTPAYRYLSGVKYYNSGSTFNLSSVASNVFNNTYHPTSPVTWTWITAGFGSGTIDFSDGSVSGVSNPPATSETMTITSKSITVSAGNNRDLNARLSMTARKAWGSNSTATSASDNRLMDAYGTTSDAKNEYFDDENRRLQSGSYDSVPSPITGQWTSSTALTNGQAQVVGGALQYPVTNYSSGYLPSQSVTYAAFSGNQVYYRAMYDAGNPHSSGTYDFGSLTNSDIGAVGSGNVNVEIKLPTQTGWLDLGKPFDSGTFTGVDGDGCNTAQSGSTWSWTAGTFTTANAGYMAIVRVTLRNGTKTISQLRETGW